MGLTAFDIVSGLDYYLPGKLKFKILRVFGFLKYLLQKNYVVIKEGGV